VVAEAVVAPVIATVVAPVVAAVDTPVIAPVIVPTDTLDVSSDELAVLASHLIIPVQGVVASQLRDTYTDARSGHTHEALDIMAPRGTPVLSATDGRLLKLFTSVAGGTMVYAADPSDRFILMYGHLDSYADGLVNGMPLTRGQLLGYVGSTGDASPGAPHLHFAIARGHPSVAWWKGDPVNPFPLFVRP
jgi:murein DD-endopeptidase MepM/ murein hydrolase activator NlpD